MSDERKKTNGEPNPNIRTPTILIPPPQTQAKVAAQVLSQAQSQPQGNEVNVHVHHHAVGPPSQAPPQAPSYWYSSQPPQPQPQAQPPQHYHHHHHHPAHYPSYPMPVPVPVPAHPPHHLSSPPPPPHMYANGPVRADGHVHGYEYAPRPYHGYATTSSPPPPPHTWTYPNLSRTPPSFVPSHSPPHSQSQSHSPSPTPTETHSPITAEEEEEEPTASEHETKISVAMKQVESLERELRRQRRELFKLNGGPLKKTFEEDDDDDDDDDEEEDNCSQPPETKKKKTTTTTASPTLTVEQLQAKLAIEIHKRKANEAMYQNQIEKLRKAHWQQLEKVQKKAAEKLEEARAKSKELLEKEKEKRKSLETLVPPSMRKKCKIDAYTASEGTLTKRKKCTLGSAWRMRFESLKRFKEEFGHCDVPRPTSISISSTPTTQTQIPTETETESPLSIDEGGTQEDAAVRGGGRGLEERKSLYHFVQSQRTGHRKMRQGKVDHSLTPQKIQLLDSIGFKWDHGIVQMPWEKRLEQLVEFKEEHGHCDVSSTFVRKGFDGFPNWVLMQRRRYREGALAPDKIAKLEELGFKWSLRDRGGTLEQRMAHVNVHTPQHHGHPGGTVAAPASVRVTSSGQDPTRDNDTGYDPTHAHDTGNTHANDENVTIGDVDIDPTLLPPQSGTDD